MKMKNIKFILNGKPYELKVKSCQTLLELIREDLNLTGTKEGCGQGECGSCTVIMNGKTVNSCLIPAVEANGQEILTIEGLQCGFCTPGMIMSAKALLDSNPDPTEAEIRESISGNFCRCTGYTKIIESINAAADLMKEK
jgi:carbon-monoxide dehydrogenase small subunit